MATILGTIIADFSTTLNLKTAIWATSATLDSATDDDNVALPTGSYFLTIDRKSANKEYIYCTLTGTSLTSIQNVSRQGVLSSGFVRTHRKSATVEITDFATIRKLADLISGATSITDATFVDLSFTGTTTAGLKVKSLTTAQRDAVSNAANWDLIYNSTTGEFNAYQWGAWSAVASGSTQPNSSTTVAGKVETATSAETIAGTDTGGTWANLLVLPSDIAKNTQSGTFVYGTDVGWDDTYVVVLTPALTTNTNGSRQTFTPTTTNTGACSVNFWGWVLNIKTKDGNDPQSWLLRALTPITGTMYGTTFILDNEDFATTANKGIVEMATDAEALAWVDTTRYINAAQLEAHSLMNAWVITNYSGLTNVTTDTTVTLTFQPRIIKLNFWLQWHDATTSYNKYYWSGWTAVYEWTTLKYTNYTASQSMLSWDNGAFDTTFSNVAGTLIKNVNGTSAPVAWTGGANASEKLVTLTVNSVSATWFVIRVVTTWWDWASSTGRANISWEAFQ